MSNRMSRIIDVALAAGGCLLTCIAVIVFLLVVAFLAAAGIALFIVVVLYIAVTALKWLGISAILTAIL